MTAAPLETVPLAAAIAGESIERADVGGLVGLVDGQDRPLPLQSMRVRAAIAGDACRTVVEQAFANSYPCPIEAVYLFPLPPDGAVVEMELRAGDRVVRGECRERGEAERAFRRACEAGHRAALLEQERPDVYSVRVANVPPGTDVCVRLVIVERLEHADGRFLWRFPTVVAPRFLPGTPVGHEGAGVLPDTDLVPDASRLQPPLRLEGGVPLDLEVSLAGPVTQLASSLHAVRVAAPDGGRGWRIAPSHRATLDRDFVLAFSCADRAATTTRAWSDGGHTLVVIEPPAEYLPPSLPRDAVFVIDISGSMVGAKIAAARLALRTALRGLVSGDRFALWAFETGLHPFEGGALHPYDAATLSRAEAWIDSLDASGGTVLLPALEASLAGTTPSGRLRTVLLITDGEVWNESQLLAAVMDRRRGARLFTMGIDTTSGSLLRDLARAGGGTHEMLAPSDDIEAAVARFESRFGSPIVDGVLVEGGAPADDAPRTLFAGSPVTLLLEGRPDTVRITGLGPSGPFRAEAPVEDTVASLGALWARERVRALERRATLEPDRADDLRTEILNVALAHHIASRYTAWVAVDTSVTVEGERVEVVQPVQLPHDWDADAWLAVRDARTGHSSGFFASARLAFGAPTAAQAFRAPMGAVPRSASSARRHHAPSSDVLREDLGHTPGAPDGEIARLVGADGSIDGDVERTAAGLAILVLMGSTRHRGIRRRAVLKMAGWLAVRRDSPAAALALEVLEEAEAGSDPAALRQRRAEALHALPDYAPWAAAAWD